MNKQLKEAISLIPYYTKITTLRYKGIKGKAWRILSEYVRMRDFIKYGTCISSGIRIANWKYVDPGHYFTMGGHGASIGFHDMNIHAQAKDDNAWGGMEAGARYKDGLIKRYGESLLVELEKIKQQGVKADGWFFLDKIKEIYGKFQQLKKEYPNFDYPEYLE